MALILTGEFCMKKLTQLLFLSLTLCSGIAVNTASLYAMQSSDDGAEDRDSDRDLRRYNKLFKRVVDCKYRAMVPLLLHLGGNPDVRDENGRTALYRYAVEGDDDRVEILLSLKADPNTKALGSQPVLSEAAEKGNTNVVKLLIAAHANLHTTALMSATLSQCPEVVELLIAAKANPNLKDDDGWTALMFAIHRGELPSKRPPFEVTLAIVRMLIAAGAEQALRSDDGWTVGNQILGISDDFTQDQKDTLLAALNPQGIICPICKNKNCCDFTLLEQCGHYFHTACINRWFARQYAQQFEELQPILFTCPICRGDVICYELTFRHPAR